MWFYWKSSRQDIRQHVFHSIEAIRPKDIFLSLITSLKKKLGLISIPDGLDAEERAIYKALFGVLRRRAGAKKKPPKLAIISDLAKDYNNLAAMVILKELERIGLVRLGGFVANLWPSEKRAIFGRGALDALGLPDIPIAIGLDAATELPPELGYEFKCSFPKPKRTIFEDGQHLLARLCNTAMERKEKITFVLLSSLTDIDTFSKQYKYFKHVTSKIFLQGGYSCSPLKPDIKAANNRIDMKAAISFHTTMEDIPSAVYTKVAAFATPLSTDLFSELAATGHKVGEHLKHVQVLQDLAFYNDSCSTNPKHMTQEQFLRNRSCWYDYYHESNTPLPVGEEIIPYLTKVVIYDALVALASSGADVLEALNIKTASLDLHEIVNSEFDGVNMAKALSALLKGSLLASLQGL